MYYSDIRNKRLNIAGTVHIILYDAYLKITMKYGYICLCNIYDVEKYKYKEFMIRKA